MTNTLQQQTLESEENILALSSIGKQWYTFKSLALERDSNSDPNATLKVNFEIDEFTVVNHRRVYSLLDWIGDVGGLFDGLKIVFFALSAKFYSFDYQSLLAT